MSAPNLRIMKLTLVEAVRLGGGGSTERRYLDFVVDGERLGPVAMSAGTISGLWLGTTEPGRSTVMCLLGKSAPDAPHGRTSIFVCPECADLGCGHITAVVDIGPDVVTWTQFGYQNNYEEDVSELEGFSDLVFDREDYERVLISALEQEFSPIDSSLQLPQFSSSKGLTRHLPFVDRWRRRSRGRGSRTP